MPAKIEQHGGFTYNGYIYTINGENTAGASVNTVYYTSVARTVVNGSLDLVGLSGQGLSDYAASGGGSTGGTLTAGNTTIAGSLNVMGATGFAQNVSVGGNLNVAGGVAQNSFGGNYLGGADVSGTTNSGSTNPGALAVYAAYGTYAFVTGAVSATACAPGSAVGCEINVYDTSTPSAPKYVGGVDSTGATNSGTGADYYNGLYVEGHYLIAAKQGNITACSGTVSAIGCELQIFDISNPAVPVYVGGADSSGAANSGTGNGCAALCSEFRAISGSGRYVFVTKAGDTTACTTTPGIADGCEVQAYDISNPKVPLYVGGGDTSGTTDSGVTGDGEGYLSVINGHYLYIGRSAGDTTTCAVGAGNARGCEVQVWNVSNPAAPAYTAGLDSTGQVNAGSATLSNFPENVVASGSYVYVLYAANATACASSAGNAIGCELQIFNNSNPDLPVFSAGMDVSGTVGSGVGNLAITNGQVAGHYLYLSHNADGTDTCASTVGTGAQGCEFQAYDISNPVSPTYIGGIDSTGSFNSGTGAATLGGIVTGNKLIAGSSADATACSQNLSAIGCELKVFNLNGIDATNVSAGSLFAGQLQVQGMGSVAGDFLIAGTLSVATNAQFSGNASITNSLNVAGPVLFRNSTDSTTAFQIQNAAGAQILTVDSTTSKVSLQGINSSAVLSAELVTSQNFQSANWISTGTGCQASGWTATTSTATHTAGGGTTACSATGTNFTVANGGVYQVTYTVTGNITAGETITPSIGGTTGSANGVGNGQIDSQIITAGSTASLSFIPTNNFNGTISVVSVKLYTTRATPTLSVLNSDGSSGVEIRSGGSSLNNTFIGFNSGLK